MMFLMIREGKGVLFLNSAKNMALISNDLVKK
jgi:hypothetical protein